MLVILIVLAGMTLFQRSRQLVAEIDRPARRFVEAVQQGRYADAYRMLSPEEAGRQTSEQFRRQAQAWNSRIAGGRIGSMVAYRWYSDLSGTRASISYRLAGSSVSSVYVTLRPDRGEWRVNSLGFGDPPGID